MSSQTTPPRALHGRLLRLSGLSPVLAALFCLAPAVAQTVPQYGLFEKSFTSTNSYANKFTDVELWLEVTGPAGVQRVRGFYDGDGTGGQNGNVWKVRYMPLEAGIHNYVTVSNDPQLDGIGGTFTVSAPSGSDIFSQHGPIRIHPANPHAVAHYDGTPFFWNGETEWFFLTHVESKISQAERLAAVDFLATKKVNNLLMTMVNSDAGFYVFPWAGTTSPDRKRFDLARLRQWEEVFQRMRSRGIVADLWFYSDDSSSLYPVAGSAEEDLYFRYMIARFAGFANVTWNLALEYPEYRSASWVTSRAAFFKSEDPYNSFLGIHDLPDDTFDFPGNPHLDHTSLQNFTTPEVLNRVVIDNRRLTAEAGRPIPIFHEEFSYEGGNNGDPNVLRRDAWAVACAGGFYKVGTLGFRRGPHYTEAVHFDHIKILYETVTSTRWWTMEPRNDLVSGGGSNRFCLARVAGADSEFLIYSISGGSFSLDLSGLAFTYPVRWVNPLTGETVKGDVTGGAAVALTNPFGTGEVAVVIGGGETDGSAPSVPQGLSAEAGAATRVDLTWQPASDPESGIADYRVYRSTSPGVGPGDFLASTGGPPSFVDFAVEPETRYYYRVSAVNGVGLESGLSAEVSVTTPAGNKPPRALDLSLAVDEDGSVSFRLQAVDPEGDTVDRFRIVTSPAKGTIAGFDETTGRGTYKPNSNVSGTDSFTFEASDNGGATYGTDATVTVSIREINDPPAPLDRTTETLEGRTVSTQLVFEDPDGPGPFTYEIVTPPENGTLSGDSNDRHYTPNPGFSGIDSFQWRVHDGLVFSEVGTWTIIVNPLTSVPPDPPLELSATAESATSIRLAWKDNSVNETAFRVERASGSADLQVRIVQYNGSATPPSVEPAGTEQSFRAGARVVNDRGDVWTRVPPELEDATRLLTARNDRRVAPVDRKYVVSVSGPCTIYLPLDPRYGGEKLTWMDAGWVDSGLTCDSTAQRNWKIWKKTVETAGEVVLGCDTGTFDGMCYVFLPQASDWQEIAVLEADTTTYLDTGLEAGTTYSYRVRAVNGAGASAYSNTASARTEARDTVPPAPPRNLRVVR